MSNTLVESVLRSQYAEGVADGFEIVLRLVMGEEASGAPPYVGPRPAELEAWCAKALLRLGRRDSA